MSSEPQKTTVCPDCFVGKRHDQGWALCEKHAAQQMTPRRWQCLSGDGATLIIDRDVDDPEHVCVSLTSSRYQDYVEVTLSEAAEMGRRLLALAEGVQ